jgi:hypothetical protein
MRKQFGLFVPISICIAVILILVSCNGTNSTPPKADTPAATVKDTPAMALSPRYSLVGNLDTLWISVDSFKNLKQRITFRFYIKAPDTLTLHGWLGDGTVFNNAPPDVILLNGGTDTSAKFGPGNYFGNLQLSRNDVTLIRNLINSTKPKPQSVLFAPLQASSNAGQITYSILLSDVANPFTKKTSYTVIPTGTTTNPSPPRNGN